jgi:hypothetical protein
MVALYDTMGKMEKHKPADSKLLRALLTKLEQLLGANEE